MKQYGFLMATIISVPVFSADGDVLLARIFDSSSDRIPTYTVAPEYPHKARRDRVEGEVQLCFDVDRDGKTRRIAVRRSSNRAFEKPSIKAVRASSFKPIGGAEPLPTIKSCRTFIFALEPLEEDSGELE